MTGRTAPGPQDISFPNRQQRLAFATEALASGQGPVPPDEVTLTPELFADWAGA